MSLIKKLAGETAIYGVSSILSRLLHWVILTPYLTSYFYEGEYGIITILYIYNAYLLILLVFRQETALFRFGSQKNLLEISFRKTSIIVLLLTLVSCTFLFIATPLIATLIEGPALYIRWIIVIILFDALSAVPFARLRLENRPIRFAALKVVGILTNIGFIFFFLELCPYLISQYDWTFLETIYNKEYSVGYVFLSNLLASGLVFLLLTPMYWQTINSRKFKQEEILDQEFAIEQQIPSEKATRLSYKQLIVYAFPLVIAAFAGTLNQFFGTNILKWIGGETEEIGWELAGSYGAIAKLAVIMNLFTQAFNYAAEPFFFRNNDRSNSDSIYANLGFMYTLVACTAFVGVMAYLDVVQLLIDNKFRDNLEIVPILLLAYLFLGLFYNFSAWYKLEDKTRYGGYIAIGGTVITVAVNFTLVPLIGIIAPAITALLCYFFMTSSSYILGRRYRPIPYPIGKMGFYILASIAAVGLILVSKSLNADNLFIRLTINTIVLFVFLGLVFVLEKKKIIQILKGID
ncbi:MAG: oligosaccharide flippase family protein [Bacteroidota bacterium]